MLKRIKIRGKLLLLLVTPIIAIAVFAADGFIDRLDRSEASTRESRLASFAAANAELSTALTVEQFQTLLTGRVMGAFSENERADRAASDQALIAWRQTVAATRTDVTDVGLRGEIILVETELERVVTADRGERLGAAELADELAALSVQLNDLNRRLGGEATSVDLFAATEGIVALSDVQEELIELVLIGDRAIALEPGNTGMAILVRDAVNSLSAAYDRAASVLDADQLDALEGLIEEGHLPRMAGRAAGIAGGFDPLGEITVATEAGPLAGGVDWTTASAHRVNQVNDLLAQIARASAFESSIVAERIETEAGQYVVLAASFVVLALAIAVIMGRSVSRPLTQLTETARVLATDELPAMVDSMRTVGTAPVAPETPLPVKGRDEVAQLGRAFADIRAVTGEVAEEQGNLLRRGISDIFVNLARRNQSLLDRQIDFIDQLEQAEENPDQLENLFRLDHLATRMRRNAESLLVLAGAEPTRRRGQPVELADVARVSMGEIEDFGRIRLGSIAPAEVAAGVAVDLAHLLSELMDNATTFSPPDSDVEVDGTPFADGTYLLTVTDHGIGMSVDQLANANTTLAEPPVLGLDLSRSLGFTVVARLAQRLGVSVRLTSPEEGGVAALVTLPSGLATPVETIVESSPESEHSSESPVPVATVPAETPPWPMTAEPTVVSADASPFSAPAEHTEDTVPSDIPLARPPAEEPVPISSPSAELFGSFAPSNAVPSLPRDRTADLFAAFDTAAARREESIEDPPAATDGPSMAPAPEPEEFWATRAAPAPVVPQPARPASEVGAIPPSVTSAGLIRRTPKVHTATTEEGRPAMGAGNRSPEEVRQMLSRYRAGLRHGRGTADPDPGLRHRGGEDA